MMDDSQSADPIAELIANYNALNSSVIEELHEEPSPLEFMRFVARNAPFVVRGAAADWQATRTWTVDFLRDLLGDQPVNVAITPTGHADAPAPLPSPDDDDSSGLVFAKPHEEDQPFRSFLSYLIAQERPSPFPSPSLSPGGTGGGGPPAEEIRYAQTQNDNLRHEYRALLSHVPPTVPWARVALARDPDAVNLWIGNSRSVTALHRDNYENLYVQVAGRKHFVLLPPACHACVNERPLRAARYVRVGQQQEREREREGGGGLRLVVEGGGGGGGADGQGEGESEGEVVPFPIWDPDRPRENATRYSGLARPMRVTLDAGDMLYLPCMWYHKVSQSCSPEGVCIAVNYWYDMDFSGPLYPLSTFVRSVSNKETYRAEAMDSLSRAQGP